MANIYAPNEDDPNFFQVFFDHFTSFAMADGFFPSLVSDVADVQSDVHPFSPKCHALPCSSFTSCNKRIKEGGDKRLLPFVSYT